MASKQKAKPSRQVLCTPNETANRFYCWVSLLQRNEWIRKLYPSGPDAKVIALIIKRLHEKFPTINPSEFRKMKAAELNEYLKEIVVDGQPAPTGAADKAPWCHSPDEERPIEQFAFGPLTATGKALDAAICNRAKPDPHYLQLRGRGADGRLWIVKRRRFCLEVWFPTEGSYRNAKQRLNAATEKPHSKTSHKRK